jgi:hypothetical protein
VQTNERACHLHYATGRIEPCPCEACAFWEPRTAILEPGCGLERLGIPLELERNSQLAHWLLDIRARLDGQRRLEARGPLIPLPPGLRD